MQHESDTLDFIKDVPNLLREIPVSFNLENSSFRFRAISTMPPNWSQVKNIPIRAYLPNSIPTRIIRLSMLVLLLER
jgi:hypothetical protein